MEETANQSVKEILEIMYRVFQSIKQIIQIYYTYCSPPPPPLLLYYFLPLSTHPMMPLLSSSL